MGGQQSWVDSRRLLPDAPAFDVEWGHLEESWSEFCCELLRDEGYGIKPAVRKETTPPRTTTKIGRILSVDLQHSAFAVEVSVNMSFFLRAHRDDRILVYEISNLARQVEEPLAIRVFSQALNVPFHCH